MINKIVLASLILLAGLAVTGCKKAEPVDTGLDQGSGVPETGLVIDISDKNGSSATTTPGDVLYIKLTGAPDYGKQWNVAAPTSGDWIMLKDHKVVDLNNQEAKEFT